MKIVPAQFEIQDDINGLEILKKIEKFGRICYKSEDLITDESCIKFVEKIIESGHESVLEHEKISVKIICDRGCSHEIVRHRIASYSMESTRYCSYNKDKFDNQISVIDLKPFFKNSESFDEWVKCIKIIEESYKKLIELGESAQIARSVLPNSLKTEIIVTMNLREWRHFLKLRTSQSAHPQIREIALQIKSQFQKLIPVVFNKI